MIGEYFDARDESSTPPLDEVIFFIVLGACYLYFLALALDFSPGARLFPISVIPVILVLIAIRLVELFRGTSHGEGTILESEQLLDAEQTEGTEQSRGRLVRMCIWPLVFAVTMYVIGIYLAIPILMFAFLFVESDYTLIKQAAMSGAVFVIIYVLFDLILNMYSYDGLIFSL